MNERAGLPALPEDLIDVDEVLSAYYNIEPDPANPLQAVVFGTSGHRGSSLDGAFNEAHIAATTQAIVEYRNAQGYDGPIFIGRDTHALSEPAEKTAVEVLVANGADVRIDSRNSYTPTPAVSLAILVENGVGSEGGDGLSPAVAAQVLYGAFLVLVLLVQPQGLVRLGKDGYQWVKDRLFKNDSKQVASTPAETSR